MSLLKVPCILLVSVAFHVAFTQPHTLLPEERPNKTSSREAFLNTFIRLIAYRKVSWKPYKVTTSPDHNLKAVFWIAGLVEIFSIVATELPILSGSMDPLVSMPFPKATFYLTPHSLLGMTLIATGGLLRWECYRTMKTLFTFEISIRKNHKLITTGPYSFVRHPAYTGTLLVHAGMYCWYGSRGSILMESGLLGSTIGRVSVMAFATMMMAVLAGLIRRVPVEDAALKEVFGAKWDAWAHQVPFAMIPGVY